MGGKKGPKFWAFFKTIWGISPKSPIEGYLAGLNFFIRGGAPPQ